MRTAAQTAAMMAALTLGTKFLGFLREVFLAGFFGTSPVTDAYVIAGAIPGILFAGVFTSMSVSYMPLFSDIMEREGREATTAETRRSQCGSPFMPVLGIIFPSAGDIFAAGFNLRPPY